MYTYLHTYLKLLLNKNKLIFILYTLNICIKHITIFIIKNNYKIIKILN